MKIDTGKMLTAQQVAERFGISTSTVRRMAYAGKIPFHQYGQRLIRFSETDVEAFEAKASRKAFTGTEA